MLLVSTILASDSVSKVPDTPEDPDDNETLCNTAIDIVAKETTSTDAYLLKTDTLINKANRSLNHFDSDDNNK